MRLIFWLLSAAMLAIYFTMVLWSLPIVTENAGGMMPFDLRAAGYSHAEAEGFLAALSDYGRAFYLNVHHRLGNTYPALMAVVLVFAFVQLYQGVLRWVAIGLAIAGAGFGYMENAAVAVMLRASGAAGDGLTEAMVATASRWTVLKSATVTLALLALIIGAVMAYLRKRRAR